MHKLTRSELEYSEQWCRSKIEQQQERIKQLEAKVEDLSLQLVDMEAELLGAEQQLAAVTEAAKAVVEDEDYEDPSDTWGQVSRRLINDLREALQQHDTSAS